MGLDIKTLRGNKENKEDEKYRKIEKNKEHLILKEKHVIQDGIMQRLVNSLWALLRDSWLKNCGVDLVNKSTSCEIMN